MMSKGLHWWWCDCEQSSGLHRLTVLLGSGGESSAIDEKANNQHLTYLTYASWFLVEQRAATTPLQRTRLWLVLFSSAHVVPAAFISASVLLRQVCFGRPTLPFPCGFHSKACLVMLEAWIHLLCEARRQGFSLGTPVSSLPSSV